MSGNGEIDHLSIQTNSIHSEQLINYLENYFDRYYTVYSKIIDDYEFNKPIEFEKVKSIVKKFKSRVFDTSYVPLEEESVQYCTIVNINSYGIFCELDNSNKVGIIFKNNLSNDLNLIFKRGDRLKVRIENFSLIHDKYDIFFLEKVD